MRVAIVHTSVDASRGGAETSIIEMAAALAAVGHEITIVTRGTGGTADRTGHPALIGLPTRGTGRTTQLFNFLDDARTYCNAARFDIVHAVVPLAGCDVYQPRGGTYAATQRANLDLLGTPFARRIKSMLAPLNRKQWRLRLAETRMLAINPPFVAAVSNMARDQISQLLPDFPTEKLSTIFNACSPERVAIRTPDATNAARRALDIPAEWEVILFVAHNFQLKGLRELLQALAPEHSPATRRLLVVAGRDRVEPYARLANRLRLSNHVRFIGSTTDVSRLYAAADVLAHPSWYDPCSRVVLEAVCHGIPVVTTERNGAVEALSNDSGFSVKSPADIRGLAAALTKALAAPARAAAKQHAMTARPRLSMERHARELTELYARVLASRSKTPRWSCR